MAAQLYFSERWFKGELESEKMTLHIQDPANPDTHYLIDKLVDACRQAKAGGGAFAFLSAGGVKLLLKNEEFSTFLERSPFNLLVGVDAITNVKAIEELLMVQAVRPNLQTKIFIPAGNSSIFHPKLAWFDTGNGGVLITGSGNLTVGGLRLNIEAFTVQKLDAEEMEKVRSHWDAYLALMSGCQLDPTDPRVTQSLLKNDALRQAMVPAAESGVSSVDVVPQTENQAGSGLAEQSADQLPAVGEATQILIAEIPRSGNRWSQANFDKSTFFGFFGASTEEQRQVYFFHVRDDGSLGDQEVRPTVAVISQNYRFELEAATDLEYPSNGKPIGLFAKIAARTFAYMLLMPGENGHSEIEDLLDKNTPVQNGRMRRVLLSASEVKPAWNSSPLWGVLTI